MSSSVPNCIVQYYSGNNQNHKLEHSHFFSNTTKVLEKYDCWSNISSLWGHTSMHIHMELLAPIDSSLSSERRLWAEDAKMSIEFPITSMTIASMTWQSRRATKIQNVLYLFWKCLWLHICLPDVPSISSDYVLFSPGRWHRFILSYLINFSCINVTTCRFLLSLVCISCLGENISFKYKRNICLIFEKEHSFSVYKRNI